MGNWRDLQVKELINVVNKKYSPIGEHIEEYPLGAMSATDLWSTQE